MNRKAARKTGGFDNLLLPLIRIQLLTSVALILVILPVVSVSALVPVLLVSTVVLGLDFSFRHYLLFRLNNWELNFP